MGRREQAREEAAFMRGDVGVDGRASAEDARSEAELQQDKARTELLRGGTWLGRELLTWLLWRSERAEALTRYQDAGLEVLFVGRIVLRGLHGEVTELSARGTLAPYSDEVRHALDRGLLIHAARLRLTYGERTWEVGLDAEHLDLKAARLPELLTEEEDDRLTERLDLADRLSDLVDALVAAFLEIRRSKAWSAREVPALKRWMKGEDRPEGSLLAKAQRARSTAAA
jgi:hypothetical protein